MKPITDENTLLRKVILQSLISITIFTIGLLTNFVSSQVQIPTAFALAMLVVFVLLNLYCEVLFLQASEDEGSIILGTAPITMRRACAGVCFLLIWSFVILIVLSLGSQWLSYYFQPSSFSGNQNEILAANILAAIIVIGLWVVLPLFLGIYLIKKDYERFPNGKLGFSETRVLVLVLLVIFNVFVVTCIGVLSWMANVMEVAANYYNIGDYFIQVVGTMRILALAVAIGICFLHYALFVLRKV